MHPVNHENIITKSISIKVDWVGQIVPIQNAHYLYDDISHTWVAISMDNYPHIETTTWYA